MIAPILLTEEYLPALDKIIEENIAWHEYHMDEAPSKEYAEAFVLGLKEAYLLACHVANELACDGFADE